MKIHCSYKKLVSIADLKPNPQNPKTHPRSQIELLAKVIAQQGWRTCITVSNLSGLVVRGHGRLLAAQHLGLDKVPVDYQDYDSPELELADLLADNQCHYLSDFDMDQVREIIGQLEAEAADLITGFDHDEVLLDMGDIDNFFDKASISETAEKSKTTCPSCGHEF